MMWAESTVFVDSVAGKIVVGSGVDACYGLIVVDCVAFVHEIVEVVRPVMLFMRHDAERSQRKAIK